MKLNQVTLPSKNIAESVAFYRTMGFRLIVDSPHYARFECDGDGDDVATFSVHHSVDDATGEWPNSGVVIYFECDDLDERVADLQSRGISFTQLPRDESWLWREARLNDPSGNVICLYWAGKNRRFPPWRVASI
jgi:catechol 2,3-dioxygenase-like lactoylglutathione lyase family enzyme